MTNQGALEGVRMKLVRAHTHIQELKSALDPLLDIDQDVIIRDTDSPPNKANFYIARVPAIELGFSAVVGDVLYSFRSGLDHLAHQLVLLDGQEPTLRTYFPIYESPKDKKGQQRQPNIQPGINRADILDALGAAQPYNQHPNRGALLSAVRDLGNIDKHRLLLAMVCALDFESGLIFWGKDHGDPDPKWKFSTRPLSDGDPIAWFDFGEEEAPADFKPHISVTMKLDEDAPGDIARKLPVVDLLETAGHAIEHIINEHFVCLFEEEWFAFDQPGGRLAPYDLARFMDDPRIPPPS